MEKIEDLNWDVIIIGGGTAGISAALWCDELGLNALLLEAKPELGGQLLRVYNPIKNHLGASAENGLEMRDIFLKQIENRKFTVEFESEVSDVDLENKKVSLENGKRFSAKFLIIAAGVRRRKLNIEGEEEFKNRGIIESGKRHQNSVKGKRVCIIGGGDAALENALILAETAAQIYLVHRRAEFSARREFVEKVRSNKKIKIFTETAAAKILGKEFVESVELHDLKNGQLSNLSVESVLTRIGVEPNTEIFQGKINLNKKGYIEIDANCETSLETIYAVGDVANPFSPTISSAVGMGATAAKTIFEKLNN
ncbi:MAG: NAD(P)/FAD-dependent oxidoreductase [Pyrinomonadaceae bacterium]